MPSPPSSPPPLRAAVTMHNGEVTCSVEETNRIRVALGMKPLRTPAGKDANHEKDSRPDAPPQLRAAVTSHNGEITCSVEETNRIRAALGLKPLRTETSSAKVELVEQKPDSKKSNDLQERLARARRARQTRSRALALRSIAEEALLGEESDDEPVDHESKLAAWVARSRKKVSESEKPTRPTALLQRKRNSASFKTDPDAKQQSVEPAIPESATHGEILTLADAPIVRDDKNDVNKDGPEDALENPLQAVKKRPRSPEICGATYDGTDAKEFSGDVEMAPGTISIEPTGPAVIESDYKEARAVDIEKAFRKRRKRDGSKREKKKRRRVREVEEEVPNEARQARVVPNVTKGRMQELRRAANTRLDAGDGSSDDDVLYASLAKARRKAKDREIKSSVDTILEAIDRANAAASAEGNGDAVTEDAEQSVYIEMEQFLQKIPTAQDSSDDDDDIMQTDERAEQKRDKVSDDVGTEMAHAKADQSVENTKHVSFEADLPGTSVADREMTENTKAIAQPAAEVLDPPVATSGDTGIAATLRKLRAMGELKHKTTQIGRAGDKRFGDRLGDNSAGDEKDVRKGARREINLSHTDEFGNELTRKEAFRMLCHKFHGKGPGQNKREKRLRKMLEAAKTRNMRADDTPLASAAALKEETRKLGTAYVVLSGPQALMHGTTRSVVPTKSEEKSPSETEGQVFNQIPDNGEVEEAKEEKVSISFGIGGRGTKRRRR